MNKKIFTYALLATLVLSVPTVELYAVQPTKRLTKRQQAIQKQKAIDAAKKSTSNTQHPIQPEVTLQEESDACEQSSTISESWGKVLRLRWTSLDRQDAKNIGKTVLVIATGYGAYIVYTTYSARVPRFNGPAGVVPRRPQPPMPPAGRDRSFNRNFNRNIPSSPQIGRPRRASFGQDTAVDQQTQTLHDLLDQEEQYRRHGQEAPIWLTRSIREIFRDSTPDVAVSPSLNIPSSPQIGTSLPRADRSDDEESSYDESESAPTEPIECSICMDDIEPQDQTKLKCGHTFCSTCVRGQIEQGLKEQNTSHIKCLDQTCNRKLEVDEIRRILNDKDMSKYYDMTLNDFFTGQDDIKHCPTPDCDYAFVHGAQDQRQDVACPSCNAQYCSDCLHNHNRNTTCEEAELTRNPSAVEKANLDWISKNTKGCPQCGHGIEKNGGCKHMTCQKCRHEFCWECLADYRGTGHGPYNCPRERIRNAVTQNDRQGLTRLRGELEVALARLNTGMFSSHADRQHQTALREYIQEINDTLNQMPQSFFNSFF